MISRLLFITILLINCFFIEAQVLPGQPVSGFPSGTTQQILSIVNPVESVIVYSTDEAIFYYYNGNQWLPLKGDSSLKTIILNRTGGYTLPNSRNTYYNFPLNDSHILTNDDNLFSVVSDGTIKVNDAGVYLISAELSTSNMPSGSIKYIIGAFRNNNLIGYLTRGFVSMESTDWWGGTGVLMYKLNANDEISLRYVLNAGRTLAGRFINISVTKIQ